MARKAVAQELSRERILEEARGLFATHGYRALTMRSIAKAMGYSHGALYYHFKEKAELFYALIRDDFSTLLHRQRELMKLHPQPGIALLQSWMLEFIRFGLDNPNHYEIMFMIDDAEILSYSRTEQAQCLDLFSSVVREVVASYGGSADTFYTLPWSMFMSLHGFISYCIHYKQAYGEVEKLAEDHVHFLSHSFKIALSEHQTVSRKTESYPEGPSMEFPMGNQKKPTRETA
ncbi:TetR/AcrR family transcriptional regulator [Gordoniibacillus kamchatkensis]|uniref:TetR/AcrR family transcriptional regulator n=1 Tax=Gordoniibacillus kamchatkensis TaxID=1590651 RepID=UPI0009E24FE2|nr:TetR/AcrR family transcriptional regulator [Paenibacillus sp. VKM B-2647]